MRDRRTRIMSILIDRFLGHATECKEADAISDGTHAFVPAVMEHIDLPAYIPATQHVYPVQTYFRENVEDDQRIYRERLRKRCMSKV